LDGTQAFEFSVKASLDNLREVRSFIARTGTALGVGERVLGDLVLAVDEAVTNIVLHGYGDAYGNIDVRMQADGDAVTIRILDRARRFDPDDIERPRFDTPLKDRPAGGMGMFLIRQVTDRMEFLPRPGGGNELRLLKRRAIGTGS
jgi:serine/threonine-protein kinase RsbW